MCFVPTIRTDPKQLTYPYPLITHLSQLQLAMAASKPIVFLAFADSAEANLPKLAEELRRVRAALAPAVVQGWCEIVERANATLDDVLAVFQQHRDQILIFHYGGHATSYQLMLTDSQGKLAAINVGGLAEFLSQQHNLHLVFLNGCTSAGQVETLLDAGVDALITTTAEIPDDAATELAAHFYTGLGQGQPLQTAYNEAVAALRALYGEAVSADGLWQLRLRPKANHLRQWRLDSAITPALPDVPCPYRGLEYFDLPHAANYFGRQEMTQRLLAKVQESNFVAVVGPSGSGKSSLVRAGLIVALQNGALAGSRAWRVEVFRPGENPLLALATPLVRLLDPTLSTVDRLAENEKLANRLRSGELSIGYVLDQLRSALPRLLLIVDQFEEIFTLCADEALRSAFLDTLLAAATKPWLTVLFTLRADFYGRVLERETLSQRVDAGLVNILPMSHAERRAAIERPAVQAGRRFESGLVERIVAAVESEPGQLPLLEFALTELWEKQTAQGLFTHAAYDAIGEVSGAIAQRADETLRSLPAVDQERVRAIFTRLVRVAPPDEGTEDTKRRLDLTELTPGLRKLVQTLADARLLVTGRDDQQQSETAEVAHEALIRKWEVLQTWLNSDREFLLWRQRLRTLVENWQASHKDEGSLLRGASLNEAQGWLATRTNELSQAEQEFIGQGLRLAKREEEENAAAAQRLRNRNRYLVIALTLALIAAAIAALFFQQAQNTAEDLAFQKETVAAALVTSDALGNERATQISAKSTAQALAVTESQNATNARATAVANADLANQQLARLKGEQLLKEVRSRKKRIISAALNTSTIVAPYIVPLTSSVTITQAMETPITVTEPFTSPEAIVREVIIIRQLLTQAIAADPTLQVARAVEEADVLRKAGTRLVQEGERLAVQGNHQAAGVLFQLAFDLRPPPDTLLYVWIAPGTFRMGLPNSDARASPDEKPEHSVNLDGYWIMRTEVTNEQYKRCVDVGPCTSPDNQRWNKVQFARQPVTNVGWQQAEIYAHWVGGRLPSEAQWEKACRGTDARIYPWGNDKPSAERANYDGSGLGTLTDIGTYPTGANGLFDMAGNVWEWTADWYDESYYVKSPTANPEGPAQGDTHPLRGGAFGNDGMNIRCTFRYKFNLPLGQDTMGFRVVSPGL